MLLDICYYIFATSSCCLTAFGLYYLYDGRHARMLTYRVSWKGIEYYTKYKVYYNENVRPLFFGVKKKKEEEDEAKLPNKLILHNTETDKYETYVDIPEGIKYDWMIVKKYDVNGSKYKVLQNMSEYEKETEETEETVNTVIDYNPFLQIEMEQDGEKIDIQDNLSFFFLEDNKILDKTFLLWYMKFFYNCDLKCNYKVHIIDRSVNLLTLDDSQYVILEKNNYIIKDN